MKKVLLSLAIMLGMGMAAPIIAMAGNGNPVTIFGNPNVHLVSVEQVGTKTLSDGTVLTYWHAVDRSGNEYYYYKDENGNPLP